MNEISVCEPLSNFLVTTAVIKFSLEIEIYDGYLNVDKNQKNTRTNHRAVQNFLPNSTQFSQVVTLPSTG